MADKDKVPSTSIKDGGNNCDSASPPKDGASDKESAKKNRNWTVNILFKYESVNDRYLNGSIVQYV